MKICFPISYPGVGGSEKYALNLAVAAQKAGHDVFFILGEHGPLENELKTAGIDYTIVPMRSSFNPVAVIFSTIKLKKIFKERKINLVHTQMLREQTLSLFAKKLGAKIKVIRTFHRLNQFNRKMKPLMRFYQSNTDCFIAPTEFMAEYMRQNGLKSKIEVIANGVEEVKVSKKEKAIGFLGRISEEKGILEFVENNIKLFNSQHKIVIAGEGPQKSALMEIARDNPNLKILGHVRNLENFFSSISVLVLPSKTEVLPLSVLESFSAGVPVVAFEIPSLEGILTSQNSILVKSGDYKKLAEKAFAVLHDDGRLKNLFVEAKKSYKENYTPREMWGKTEKIYQKALKNEA